MKNIYIIIGFLILLFIFDKYNKSNKSKEHLNTESVNNIFGLCYDNAGNVKYSNVNVTGTFQMKTKTLKDYMVDRIYPIGSFYVQYPDKNTNVIDEAFPESMSPSKLFGGDWQEQWGNESIYFRTLGPYADENRINGIQDYALPPLYGHTSFVQTDLANPGGGSDGIFSQSGTMKIGTDGGDGRSFGHRNYFDSSTQALSSDLETRARNRQIKVWKRVQLTSNKTFPPLPPNGYDEKNDYKWYDGPYPELIYLSPLLLPNAKTIEDAKRICNDDYNCTAVSIQDDKYYMSVGGDPIYNSNKNNKIWKKKEIRSIIETNNDSSTELQTKKSEFSSLPV
jgi:hypothetical protein